MILFTFSLAFIICSCPCKNDYKDEKDKPSLGHVPTNSEVFDQSFVGWAENIFDKNKIPDEGEDNS